MLNDSSYLAATRADNGHDDIDFSKLEGDNNSPIINLLALAVVLSAGLFVYSLFSEPSW